MSSSHLGAMEELIMDLPYSEVFRTMTNMEGIPYEGGGQGAFQTLRDGVYSITIM